MKVRIFIVVVLLFAGNQVFSQTAKPLEQLIADLEGRGDNDSLILVLEHSLAKVDLNQKAKAPHLTRLIKAYIDAGDYTNANVYSAKLIDWLKNDNPSKQLAEAYGLRATAYYYLKDLTQATKFAESSFRIQSVLNDTTEMIRDLIRLGILNQESNENRKALKWYREAERLSTDDHRLLSNLFSCYSVVYSALKQNDSSLYYIKKSLAHVKRQTPVDIEGMVNSYFNLAATYADIGNDAMTIQYLDSASRYSWTEIPSKLKSKILLLYYKTYFKRHDNLRGNEYLEKYIAHHDTVFQQKMSRELHELSVLNERDKLTNENRKMAELSILQLRQWILIVVLIALFITIAAGVYSFYNLKRKNKFERDKISIEQRLLRAQMNPHFILNSLAGIQMLIEDNQTVKASDYLNSFARLMQITLENSRENYITIDSEVKALEKYLSLQQMRFEHEFAYLIEVNGNNHDSAVLIPPMIIQPFVENAIQHGIRSTGREGIIKISINVNDKFIVCTIDDNGKGLAKSMKNTSKQSLSTQIVRERLAILSDELNREASLTVSDKKDNGGQGVLVKLIIPYLSSC